MLETSILHGLSKISLLTNYRVFYKKAKGLSTDRPFFRSHISPKMAEGVGFAPEASLPFTPGRGIAPSRRISFSARSNPLFYSLLHSFWRRGWDSNPRAVSDKLISSQPRYDHFDTPPDIFTA
jgi:hypothetical protein